MEMDAFSEVYLFLKWEYFFFYTESGKRKDI